MWAAPGRQATAPYASSRLPTWTGPPNVYWQGYVASSCGDGELGRRGGVLPEDVGNAGRAACAKNLPAADGGGMGVCVPGGGSHAAMTSATTQPSSASTLGCGQLWQHDTSGWPEETERLGAVRYARERVEWCQDWYDPAYYASCPVEDPAGVPQASGRVTGAAAGADRSSCLRRTATGSCAGPGRRPGLPRGPSSAGFEARGRVRLRCYGFSAGWHWLCQCTRTSRGTRKGP